MIKIRFMGHPINQQTPQTIVLILYYCIYLFAIVFSNVSKHSRTCLLRVFNYIHKSNTIFNHNFSIITFALTLFFTALILYQLYNPKSLKNKKDTFGSLDHLIVEY